MKPPDMESLHAAPVLLDALRKGQTEFGIAANRFAAEPRRVGMDTASEECLELLDHLIDRLREQGRISCRGLEDACIFLLEHLAARLQEQEKTRPGIGNSPIIQ
jgi:hypothetical protein